ncbi:MAG: type I secretion system permease/ATPase [Deltaproteobacteria bacterium]|nr:type I secretion system permease/ATPase [Candidatus Tharpella sp.]
MRKFMIRWSRFFTFAGIFSLFINLLYLTFPIYMLAIYDRVLSSYSIPTLITITTAAMLAHVVLGILDFLRSRLLVMAGVEIDKTLSPMVLSEMLRDSTRLQKIGYNQGLRDVNLLRNYFAGNAIFAIFDCPWVPIYLLIIYVIHPLMGLVATGGAVVIIILGLIQDKLTNKRLLVANLLSNQSQGLVGMSLRNSEAVNAMGMTPGVIEHWDRINNQLVDFQTRASRDAGLIQSITKTIRISMQVIIYGVGAWLTLKNECTAGVMISSSIIMGRALGPIESGMATWKMTIDARGAYKRIDALLKIIKPGESMELPEPKGAIAVENATLAIAGKYILQNVTFNLEPGESLGLIGASAAGKTTLCRLLLGLWPSMGGKVRLDGSDIFVWDSERLGRFIGYLPQDVELFPGTVSDNIARLGEIDVDQVITAAKAAGIHELILKLPNGYDTDVSPGSGALSGGQRQRLGIARALYGKPRFIVLDEPNSNLDEAGELELLKTIAGLKALQITTVIVTHKPALLAGVDKILLLKEGRTAMYGPRQQVFDALNEVAQKARGEAPTASAAPSPAAAPVKPTPTPTLIAIGPPNYGPAPGE